MNKKYVLTSLAFEGSITVEYNEVGYLVSYDSEAEMNEEQMRYWATKFPSCTDRLNGLAAVTKLTIKEVPADISFDAFWEKYEYKVGSKKRAEKLYNALCAADKVLAIACIPAYNYFLTCKKTQDKMYPETYINKRGFEVDYKKLIKK